MGSAALSYRDQRFDLTIPLRDRLFRTHFIFPKKKILLFFLKFSLSIDHLNRNVN